MKEIILMKYGELALKGTNRGTFENILVKNIRRRISSLGEFTVSKAQSTITVTPKEDNVDMGEVYERLSKVFGLSAISRSAMMEKDFSVIVDNIGYLDDALANAKSFKVNAKRSDKTFPMGSPEICADLGHHILERHPHLTVDVHNPDLVVWCEIRDKFAYLHAGQQPGAGGIPVGSGGKAALLLSGGIDSPVAGYMMAKRGLEVMAIHFASPPYTSERALLKVKELSRRMSAYTGRVKLAVVPFTEIQQLIGENCPEEYFTIIMRRFMMEIASKIAEKNDCGALITGESLGQVASQTMQAIACTDAASELPVLRPLIGMDKEEIVVISRKIDTFETSILPYEDCCTVFTPRHPKTKPHLHFVIDAERTLDREALMARAVEDTEFVWIDESTEFI
ncbi:MAG: tRNA 4-thiouridine(8) synthase ThiI [Oscillospiraceae bacterium]|nr:tRNA 4-thiouridine(8) synthase ThiI [Oscillospiraceae bacterium]